MSKFSCRVYYEDTDDGGVVYYANYLKFAERARTELLRELGINQSTLTQTDNILFVVRHASMDLLKPAKLDDMLDITTQITTVSGASINMHQQIYCGAQKLTDILVKIACVNAAIRPKKLPKNIKEKLTNI
jgi:acyl-CoA thioester hydrolase